MTMRVAANATVCSPGWSRCARRSACTRRTRESGWKIALGCRSSSLSGRPGTRTRSGPWRTLRRRNPRTRWRK
eukprot:14343364-Alexandrium_andersonii.AAC.1